jgi:hypothetical protein
LARCRFEGRIRATRRFASSDLSECRSRDDRKHRWLEKNVK